MNENPFEQDKYVVINNQDIWEILSKDKICVFIKDNSDDYDVEEAVAEKLGIELIVYLMSTYLVKEFNTVEEAHEFVDSFYLHWKDRVFVCAYVNGRFECDNT